MLAVFRPRRLSKDRPFTFLPDCPEMSSHPDNVLVVSFSRRTGEGALFLLERSCSKTSAMKALRQAEAVRAAIPLQIAFPRIEVE
jgi:hypothetical protein